MNQNRPSTQPVVSILLGLGGAVLGGAIGFYICVWLHRQGFYALALPGAGLGMGCGMLSRTRSVPLAVICAISAAVLGVFTEWRMRPFENDKSLEFFLKNIQDINAPITWVFLVLGVVFAAWFGLGRERFVQVRGYSNDA